MSRETDIKTPTGRAVDTPLGRDRGALPPDRGPSPIVRPLFSLGAILFAVALFLPTTGWILGVQTRVAIGGRLPGITQTASGADTPEAAPLRRKQAEFAVRHADDFEVQLADAILHVPSSNPADGIPQSTKRVDSLLDLRVRFGNRPELYATVLRFLCQGALTAVPRDGNALLEAQDEKALAQMIQGFAAKRKRLDPVRLAQFEEAATRGEQLDPDNAFFPQMLAVVLLARNRDTEAFAALHRAAQKPHWDDYAYTEMAGRLRLLDATMGHTGVLTRSLVGAELLFPHFATLRSAARVAIHDAVVAEQEGDVQTGLQIRHDIARIGAKMRVQGRWTISSLVGQAITRISMLRPGGSPAEKEAHNDEAIARRLNAYIAYLNRVGDAGEAAWFLAESRKQEAARDVISRSQDKSIWDIRRLLQLASLWGVGTFCLVNALYLLLFGGAATLLSRLRQFQQGEALPRGVRIGLCVTGFGLLLLGYSPIQSIFFSSESSTTGEQMIGALYPAVFVLIVALALLKHRETGRGFGRNLLQCAATLIVCGVLAAAVYFHQSRISDVINAGYSVLLVDTCNGGMNIPAPWMLLLSLAGVGLTIIAALVRREKGLPASVKIVRFFRNTAPLAIGVLLAVTTIAAFPVAVTEGKLQAELSQMYQHEGQYAAGLVHAEWPGAVDETALR